MPMPAEAVPYWRAGLRTADALTAARVAAAYRRKQRNRMVTAMVEHGSPLATVAEAFGLSPSSVRRIAGDALRAG